MNENYSPAAGAVFASSCGEYYLVNAKERMRISETGAFYWQCICEGMTYSQMKEKVADEFETDDMENVENDLEFFLKLLIVKGMIQEKRIKA